jgi:glycosyltransferase involved in cell wall biosynthesis
VRAGVRVRRFRIAGFGRGSRIGRILDYALFYVRVAWVTVLGDRSTPTVFLTTPPLLGTIGWVARTLRGRRYAIWSMDLHPDAEIAAGMIHSHGAIARSLVWLNDRSYRNADAVIDLGPYMRRRILARGVEPERLHTVPVWGHEAVDQASPAAGRVGGPADSGASALSLREQWGLVGKYVVMYAGNAGIVHDFRDVLEAMRLRRDDPTLFFLFVGGGPRRAAIEAFAKEHDLRNFAYRDYVSRDEVSVALLMADIHLITLLPAFAGISVPGKLYGIMAASRPALFVGPSACETADTIRDASCGVVIDPAEGPAAGRIVEAIRAWRDDPAAARSAGARGRITYLSRFQRDTNCRAFATVLSRTWPNVIPEAATLEK